MRRGRPARELRRHRAGGRRAGRRLAGLELTWGRTPGLTAQMLVDRVRAGAYGEAAETAATAAAPRGAGAEWAAGWAAAQKLITVRLAALADAAGQEGELPGAADPTATQMG